MEKKTSSAPADSSAASETASANNPAPEGASPAAAPVENTIRVEGVLDIDLQRGGNGQLVDLNKGGKRRPTDRSCRRS